MSRHNRTWLAGAGAIAVIAVLLHAAWPSSDSPVVVADHPVASGPVGPLAAIPADPSPSTPSTPSTNSLTDRRSTVWDAKDVRAAAEAIRASGTADEKRWARDLVRECLPLIATSLAAEVTNAIAANAARRTAELNRRMVVASSALQRRCERMGQLDRAQQRALLAALANGAAQVGDDGVTTLQTLADMETRLRDGDDRWNAVESTILDRALYSGDPYLERVAFNVLTSAIDRKAPGGDDRLRAIAGAMSPAYLDPPLSDFEALERCAIGGSCGMETNATHDADVAVSANVARLTADYGAAFASRQPSQVILAMR